MISVTERDALPNNVKDFWLIGVTNNLYELGRLLHPIPIRVGVSSYEWILI